MVIVDVSPDSSRSTQVGSTIRSFVHAMNNVALSDLHLIYKSRRDVQNAVKQQLHEVTKDEGVYYFYCRIWFKIAKLKNTLGEPTSPEFARK